MYSHTLMRLAYGPICFITFVSGVSIGCLLGLLFFLMDRTVVGLLASTFIALLTGLCSAFFGLIYTAIFNLLAPAIGGIPLELSPSSSTGKDSAVIEPLDSSIS